MLKIIDIEQVEVGMYVDSIAEQSGDLQIKSRGRVTQQAAIQELKKQGIQKVVIDLSKQLLEPEIAPEQTPSKEPVQAVDFEGEIQNAAKLYTQGKALQQELFNQIAKRLPIDLIASKEYTQNLVSSIDRNPNALMCMTKIREKDEYLLEHSLNVSILLINFGKQLGLTPEKIQDLALSGFLHDIGKISIPDEILHKPGRLSDSEMDIMREHVKRGTAILQDVGLPADIIRTIGEHHERLDGQGYPVGAKGDEISEFGRLIAIADTYDAITADRCYKAGMPSKTALQILIKNSPEKYDHALVMQFVKTVGLYPVGTLVKLSNERIAMVLALHPTESSRPKVKVFYSLRGNHYLPPTDLDLAAPSNQVDIVEPVNAQDYKLDFNKYFAQSVLP
jgi:putative nucleotidyltransferase with HDIG domain